MLLVAKGFNSIGSLTVRVINMILNSSYLNKIGNAVFQIEPIVFG